MSSVCSNNFCVFCTYDDTFSFVLRRAIIYASVILCEFVACMMTASCTSVARACFSFVLARESGIQRPVAIHMTSTNKLIVVQSDGMVKVSVGRISSLLIPFTALPTGGNHGSFLRVLFSVEF